MLAPAQYSYADMNTPQQLSWINSFELHIEFYCMSNLGTQMIIDTSASGTKYPGFQMPGFQQTQQPVFWQFSFSDGVNPQRDFTVPITIIPMQNWYKLVFRNSKNVFYAHVENMQGIILAQYTNTTTTISTTQLASKPYGMQERELPSPTWRSKSVRQ